MIVADTNLIAYRLIEGERHGIALEVAAIDPDWRVPPLWRYEFLSVLAIRAAHGYLTEDRCQSLFNEAVELFQNNEYYPILSDALSLAIREKITPYDAQFVVLARRLGTRLVTSDKEILRKFPRDAIAPEKFVAAGIKVN